MPIRSRYRTIGSSLAKDKSADAAHLIHVILAIERHHEGVKGVRRDRHQHLGCFAAPAGGMIDMVFVDLLPDLAVDQGNGEGTILVHDKGLHRHSVDNRLGTAEQAAQYADSSWHWGWLWRSGGSRGRRQGKLLRRRYRHRPGHSLRCRQA